ncbi:MAG TPA: ABC transporter permease, partial [Cyclobacteriaceae bacterium]|nr:ABC transporter permease [Cyclobacteriaceae bacterium]
MIRNYLIVAIRNLWKKGTHSLINSVGLALGIASCLMVFVYVKNELTFDQFHKNGANIYRINCKYFNSDNVWEEYGTTAPVMAPELAREVPEFSSTMRLSRLSALVRLNGNVQEEHFTFIDPSVLQGFTFPLIAGEAKSFSEDPNSILITEETAKRFFADQPAVGQKIEMEFKHQYETFVVKGVLKDIPFNSSIRFNLVLPYAKYQQIAHPFRFSEWLDQHIASFVLIDKPFDRTALEKKITEIFRSRIEEKFRSRFEVTLQPLGDIHLNKSVSGGNGVQTSTSFTTSWLLIGIGAFLLLIASINFINISIGMALPRSREIGLRKVVGARRRQIITQFLGESFLVCMLAMVCGVALVDLFMPVFERLTNQSLVLWKENTVGVIIALFAILMLTALLAGMYPALVVSKFNPVKSLKGEQRVGGRNYLTRGLILLQFMLGIMFLFGSLTIQSQLQYIKDFDLGYDDKGLVGMGAASGERADVLIGRLRNELASSPYIKSISGNTGDNNRTIIKHEGKEIPVYHARVDYNFLETYGVKLIEGRTFYSNPDSLSKVDTRSILVNETFVRTLGLKDPLGMVIPFRFGEDAPEHTIIGVVPDFHFASLKDKVKPLMLFTDPTMDLDQFLIRLDPDHTAEGIEALHDAWNKLVPNRPFQYIFAADGNAQYYAAEQKQKEIVSYASFFALFIS